MLADIINKTRGKRPLVHCITNYVTANDCANLLLACGASPIMADDPDEAEQITSIANGLVLNMGIPSPRKLDAMQISGRVAKCLNLPVVLDPAGVGCSRLRLESARAMLAELRFACIRGNASEIAALVRGYEACGGVDDDGACVENAQEDAKMLARKTGAVVVLTGDADIVTDGSRLYRVRNGHPMMRLVTGTGCQLSALIGAYLAANPASPLEAALAAVCAMGICGEQAFKRLSTDEGNASYRNYIIDALFRLSPEALEEGANYEAEQ